MAATEHEISEVFHRLQAFHKVTVNVEWFEACISWLKQQNANNVTMPQLKELVYEQWLMSDLSESGSNCLPEQIASIPKMQIPGCIALQVNFVLNVTESAYSQLKKLKGETLSESNEKKESWQPKPNRMLMLHMTDGTQLVKGMEYEPIKELHCDLIPGTKVLVKSGALCRMGVILLTKENITILGGQVSDVIEQNSQLKVLKRTVGEKDEEDGERAPTENAGQHVIGNNGEDANTHQHPRDTLLCDTARNTVKELDIDALLGDDDLNEFLAVHDA